MRSLTFRARAAIAGILTVFAVVVPAVAAQASIPQGASRSVTCPDGASNCTEYRYGFYPSGATGQFGIYITVKWSSTGGSWRVVKMSWINNSTKTVYFGDYAVFDAAQNTLYYLGYGGSSSTYAIGASSSYTFNESQFNGAGKGHYVNAYHGSYAESDPGIPSWEYHVSGYGGFTGAFYTN